MNIAQSLRELLESNNISRSKLSREIGVHTSTVSNWLDGKSAKSENLEALCSYFGCSLDYLTRTTPSAGDEQKNKPPADSEGLTDLQAEAVNFIRGLSDEELRRFMKLARAMFSD